MSEIFHFQRGFTALYYAAGKKNGIFDVLVEYGAGMNDTKPKVIFKWIFSDCGEK